MKDWKSVASSKPEQACSIFCGVLDYDEKVLEEIQSGNNFGFTNWVPHINPENIPAEKILKNFHRYYYESFVNCIFPDKEQSGHHLYNEDYAAKTIRLTRRISQEMPLSVPNRGIFNIRFEYLDLYFFPHNIVFYCFKCDLSDFSMDDITLINNYLRNSGPTDDLAFIYDHLDFLTATEGDEIIPARMSFGNKLKVFSLIEHGMDLSKEEESMLLYDLGNCAPIGSAAGAQPYFQPSQEYYSELISTNRINVFDNWSALSLFDTFTGLFRRGALDKFSWENAYFNLLYLHSLYVKNHLFKVNRAFYSEEKHYQELEDEFYDFDKYYNPSHISYNFLPGIIYNAIRRSLAIEGELSLLKEGIERWNQKAKEKRDKMINDVLTVIALLAVFSIIWDLSEWINKLFSGSTTSYLVMSGTLTVLVMTILIMFLIRNFKKKR